MLSDRKDGRHGATIRAANVQPYAAANRSWASLAEAIMYCWDARHPRHKHYLQPGSLHLAWGQGRACSPGVPWAWHQQACHVVLGILPLLAWEWLEAGDSLQLLVEEGLQALGVDDCIGRLDAERGPYRSCLHLRIVPISRAGC